MFEEQEEQKAIQVFFETGADSQPFALAFKERFGAELNKPKLAAFLAEAMLSDGALLWEEAVTESAQECSEIARFLRFLIMW